MPANVDLYNTSYGNPDADAYREIRTETYGKDYGQTSWMASEEFHEISRMLALSSSSHALEIGSGAGGCALHHAGALNCRVIGLDMNAAGVREANQRAKEQRLEGSVRFEQADASQRLRFDDNSFDAAYSNDAICHLPNRAGVLAELHRVLKPGGRLLFSDALVITGLVTNEELATRSSIGHYVFAAPGENEKLIAEAGMELLRATDTTENAAAISQRWHDARAARRAVLIPIEGEPNFAGLQKFLKCVHTLSSEKRLSRFLYLARK
jgi:ubiquinone/menaquinone biosynthesis C-methylase UbiE